MNDNKNQKQLSNTPKNRRILFIFWLVETGLIQRKFKNKKGSTMDEAKLHHEKKKVFNHVMRAKLYGVIAINSIEGITSEIDNLLPEELEKGMNPFMI